MKKSEQNLSIARNMKIGTFHIGSSMADVLGSGVWNRVMIKDLGIAATPVSLLLALRYFLVPLAIWAGNRSDSTNVGGYRRLPWVWGGRLGMIFGYLLVAFSTVEFARHGAEWWLGIAIGFLLISIGYSISGSTFLALVYDRAPAHQRGRAVGIVWTFLLAGYALAGVFFARLLPEYTEGDFIRFFGIVTVVMVGIWIFALWGEEKPSHTPQAQATEAPNLKDLWKNSESRWLAIFMALSFIAAFMQDPLLEPFGGKVFDLSVGETTRFQAYWGTMAILSSVFTLWAYRRYENMGYQGFTRWGVVLLLLTYLTLTFTAFTERESLLRPCLILLGLGYGLWNIGTLGLMVKQSRESHAGFDLGVWTVVATLCRGGGVLLGGVLYDLFNWQLQETQAYGMVFGLASVLLASSLLALNQIAQAPAPVLPHESELLLASSMD